MTAREPYLVLRDFRVWFAKRRGFFEALRRAEPQYIRAVDGIDLDIGKGEIYCLVGESGCGKTTTGKGILKLVEPTGGDVFVGVPPEELKAYEEARSRNDTATLERIRRQKSLTYKESVRWTPRKFLKNLAWTALGAAAAALLVAGFLVGLAALGASAWEFVGFLLAGAVLGIVATLPWLTHTSRLPMYFFPIGIGSAAVGHVLATWLSLMLAGQPADSGAVAAVYGAIVASNSFFLYALEYLLLGLLAWYAGRVMIGFWRRRQGLEADRMRKLRKTLQIIFQDPYESLNPKHSVYDIVAEPLVVNRLTRSRAETEARVEQALMDAGLRPPRDFMFRYPHELSGGQRQRVSIAGALVLEPDFLVADEPVSMLDVSIRTEIIELLLELRKQKGLTYLFITHDLSLAWVLADRIGVMYLGKIVEEGPVREVIRNPKHPYTKALISVVPVPDPDRRHERIILKGERPDPANIPPGCRFHPRCPVAFEKCGWSAEEVLDDLRELAAASGGVAPYVAAGTVDGPLGFTLRGPPERVEAWLREQIAARSEEVRSLKAIRAVERTAEGVKVSLHNSAEPALKVLAPNVKVACHLYG